MGMALGILASAAVLFHVGVNDALSALAYGGRVVGAVFLIAILVEAVAILALCDYWGMRTLRYSGVAVLLGVGTVVVTDLMFLIVQIQGAEYTVFLWLWIGLAIWAIWALWLLTQQKVWQGIPHTKGVALSVVVSGAIGATSLGYSQLYVPYNTPVKTLINVTFDDPTAATDGSLLHVPVKFKLQNTGSVGVFLVGSSWTAQGSPTKFNREGSGMNDWKRSVEIPGDNEMLRHVAFYPSHMLGTGTIATPGAWVDPGAEYSLEEIVDVPLRSGFSRIEVFIYLGFLRGDRCKPASDYAASLEVSWDAKSREKKHIRDAPAWLAHPGDEFYRHHSKVSYSSEILNLTHTTAYANAWWVFPRWREGVSFAKGDTFPYMDVAISHEPEGDKLMSQSEEPECGMTLIRRKFVATVDQLLKAAKE
ncbi:hypothetical protein ABT404_49000 [Streptomyces hyaluromycini]|uniref:Uncharacterized protein n=1 Tax=Streptomyces hyaluromycini TaxID=1377993 RepID=A0ABV1XE54_9ACTN